MADPREVLDLSRPDGQDDPLVQPMERLTAEERDAESFKAGASEFSKGARAGFNQLGATFNAFVGNLAESAGLSEFAASRMAEAERFTSFAEAVGPDVKDYRQVKDFGTLVDYVAGALGNASASMLPAIAGGGAGAMLAKGARGAFAGAFGGSLVPNAGEQALRIKDAPGTPGEKTANMLGVGTGAALLDSVLVGRAAGRLARPSLRSGGLVKEVSKGAGIEGATEASQELLGQAGHTALEPGRDKSGDTHALIESGIQGAIGGAGFGAGSRAAEVLPGAVADGVQGVQKALTKRQRVEQIADETPDVVDSDDLSKIINDPAIASDPEAVGRAIDQLDADEESSLTKVARKMGDAAAKFEGWVNDPEKRAEFKAAAKQWVNDQKHAPRVKREFEKVKKSFDEALEAGKAAYEEGRVKKSLMSIIGSDAKNDPDSGGDLGLDGDRIDDLTKQVQEQLRLRREARARGETVADADFDKMLATSKLPSLRVIEGMLGKAPKRSDVRTKLDLQLHDYLMPRLPERTLNNLTPSQRMDLTQYVKHAAMNQFGQKQPLPPELLAMLGKDGEGTIMGALDLMEKSRAFDDARQRSTFADTDVAEPMSDEQVRGIKAAERRERLQKAVREVRGKSRMFRDRVSEVVQEEMDDELLDSPEDRAYATREFVRALNDYDEGPLPAPVEGVENQRLGPKAQRLMGLAREIFKDPERALRRIENVGDFVYLSQEEEDSIGLPQTKTAMEQAFEEAQEGTSDDAPVRTDGDGFVARRDAEASFAGDARLRTYESVDEAKRGLEALESDYRGLSHEVSFDSVPEEKFDPERNDFVRTGRYTLVAKPRDGSAMTSGDWKKVTDTAPGKQAGFEHSTVTVKRKSDPTHPVRVSLKALTRWAVQTTDRAGRGEHDIDYEADMVLRGLAALVGDPDTKEVWDKMGKEGRKLAGDGKEWDFPDDTVMGVFGKGKDRHEVTWEEVRTRTRVPAEVHRLRRLTQNPVELAESAQGLSEVDQPLPEMPKREDYDTDADFEQAATRFERAAQAHEPGILQQVDELLENAEQALRDAEEALALAPTSRGTKIDPLVAAVADAKDAVDDAVVAGKGVAEAVAKARDAHAANPKDIPLKHAYGAAKDARRKAEVLWGQARDAMERAEAELAAARKRNKEWYGLSDKEKKARQAGRRDLEATVNAARKERNRLRAARERVAAEADRRRREGDRPLRELGDNDIDEQIRHQSSDPLTTQERERVEGKGERTVQEETGETLHGAPRRVGGGGYQPHEVGQRPEDRAAGPVNEEGPPAPFKPRNPPEPPRGGKLSLMENQKAGLLDRAKSMSGPEWRTYFERVMKSTNTVALNDTLEFLDEALASDAEIGGEAGRRLEFLQEKVAERISDLAYVEGKRVDPAKTDDAAVVWGATKGEEVIGVFSDHAGAQAAVEVYDGDATVQDKMGNLRGKFKAPESLPKPDLRTVKASGPITEEEKAEVRAYVERVLGKKATKVLFKNLKHAGDFFTKDGVEVLRVANLAMDPMGTARHEAAHALFARLLKHDKAAAQTLLAAAQSPSVVSRLRELLKDHPDALKQLSDPEERLAYMYQFWNAGALQAGPKTEKWFDRVKAFFRKVMSVWTGTFYESENADKAAQIFDLFDRGALSNRDTVAEVLRDKLVKSAVTRASELMGPAAKAARGLVYTSVSNVKAMNVPAFNEVMDKMWYDATKGGKAEPGFNQAKHPVRNRLLSKLEAAIGSASAETRREALEALQTNTAPASAEARAVVAGVRGLLSETFTYMKGKGVKAVVWNAADSKYEEHDIGFVKDYFPRYYDRQAIVERRGEFLAMLRKNGVPEAEAQEVYESVTRSQPRSPAESDYEVGLTYYAPNTQARKLDIPAAELAPFLRKDLGDAMRSYIAFAVRRAEYASRFGNQGQEIKAAEERAVKEQGATAEQVKSFNRAVQALEGSLGHDIDPSLKNAMGAVQTYQHVRLLPLAIFSSLTVDPLGIMVRGGTAGDSFRAFARVVRNLVSEAKDEAYDMAVTVGSISSAIDTHMLQEAYGMQDFGGTTQKINSALFRWNGMDSLNRSMRVAATAAGHDFIVRHLTKPGDHSKRYLEELGLDDSVKVVDGKLDLTDQRVANALNLWVDGAVLRPNAAIRPAWTSDPHWMLVSSLKQYMYAFQETIIKRAVHEAGNGNVAPVYALMAYVPAIIAADLLRAALTPGSGDDEAWERMELSDVLLRGIQRAGVTGPMGQYAMDAMGDMGHYNVPFASLAGPTGEQLLNIGAAAAGAPGKDLGREAVRAIPGYILVR